MAPRPMHIDLSDEASYYDDQQQPRPPRPPFYVDLPSPRTGEAPPALSPLDAFAQQSRMLAKKFEAAQDGRRISRLPYRDVAKEFGHRPGYFGDLNDVVGTNSLPESREETDSPPGSGTQVTDPSAKNRPVSHYPLFGHMDRSSLAESGLGTPFDEVDEEDEEGGSKEERDYFAFAAPRAASPEPFESKMVNVAPPTPNMPSLTSSVDSVQSSSNLPRTLTNGSTRSYRSLAPPRSPAFPKSPRSLQSIRSVRQDSGDDDASTSGSHPISSRKFSGSSNMSRPQSPMSPWMQPFQRSPSMTSEFSMTGSQQAVRPMNFSRPMSSASNRAPTLDARPSLDSRSSFETRPSTDLPLRNFPSASSVVQSSIMPPRDISDDSLASPFPPMSDTDTLGADRPETAPNSSYTYAKFALPRGRNRERHSNGLRESWIESQFTWDKPVSAPPPTDHPPAPTRVFTASSDDMHTIGARPPSAGSARLPQEHTERVGRQRAMSSANRSRSAGPRPFSFEPSPAAILAQEPLPRSSPSIRTHATDSTDRTIKATRNKHNHQHNLSQQSSSTSRPLHTRSTSELTPEAHLEIGIAAHSRGELNKSTYHLRLAAKAGLPTAMLLYALACRHGWGMRPNQADGVMWLRRAIETAGVEVTTGLDAAAAAFSIEALSEASRGKQTAAAESKGGAVPSHAPSASQSSASPAAGSVDVVADAVEGRKRKAQFALAIYELGISYMNGWGCAKDKALAVRCYEVAGSWGDCDALAEAGFCYTQGLGVKKDLKKAAALYRKAADGGMSMAGNSWIYKAKYMDDSASVHKSPDKDKVAAAAKGSGGNRGGDGVAAGNDPAAANAAGAKPVTRTRARSIWGRGKKEK